MAPDAAGGATLARVFAEGCDLDRPGLGAGQGGARPGGGHDHAGLGVECAEPGDVLARGHPDSGHTAAAASLRPDAVGVEVESRPSLVMKQSVSRPVSS